MEASLEILMKKTQNECDQFFRSCAMNWNGMAGLCILKGDLEQAIQLYETVLNAAQKEFDANVRLDNLQKIHALHNYIELLKQNESKSAVEKIRGLDDELRDCEKQYLGVFEEKKSKSVVKFVEKEDAISRDIKKV